MNANADILAAIEGYIKSKHKLGEQTGGSGHKGFVSFRLDEYDQQKLKDGKTEVSFKYTIFTETEFTYYPDNPPYEDHYEAIIKIDV